MTGRPTKLTPEAHASIVKDIGNGVTFVTAAGAAGVDRLTLNAWMKRGEAEGKGIYYNFYNACNHAKAEALKKFTLVVSKAASEGDWKAALEYLKRHDPENWGDKTTTTLQGPGGGPIEVKDAGDVISKLLPEPTTD